jgi:pimeloyl-ACP methyl ester carboxylesterase
LRCRLDALALDDAARASGVSLIAPDRPGIGASDRHAGRRLVDWPADVAALADALGLERFAVLGWSLGGPHALACAAVLAERVVAVATVGSTIPADWPGMRDEVNRLDRRLMRLSSRSPFLARRVIGGLRLVARHSPGRLAAMTARELDPASAAAVRADSAGWAAGQAEGLAHPDGVLDDYRVMDAPWGLELERIEQPVHLWQGGADTLVPSPWAVRLADALPAAQVGALAGEGHVLAPARYEEILSTLAAPCASGG